MTKRESPVACNALCLADIGDYDELVLGLEFCGWVIHVEVQKVMNHGILLSDSILDVPSTLARLGGDQSLFADLIGFFLADAPQCLAELRRAAEAKDFAQTRWKAHALKGLVAGCGGQRATAAAQLIEGAAQSGNSEDLDALIPSLEQEVHSLQDALIAYRSQIIAGDGHARPR